MNNQFSFSNGISRNQHVLIDTNRFSEITPPGLSSPKNAISYHDTVVQDFLKTAFKGIFPEIIETPEGYAYQAIDKSGRDRCSLSKPAHNLSDIPKGEVLKLTEGWIRLRRKITEEETQIDSKTRSILLNIKIPDPALSTELRS
ncbi:hypothetical protein OAB00_01505 [Akkermansiaceae bacterium]|nr:hypothetical protein [Akkermansiaceae bacterium]